VIGIYYRHGFFAEAIT